jgi:transposase
MREQGHGWPPRPDARSVENIVRLGGGPRATGATTECADGFSTSIRFDTEVRIQTLERRLGAAQLVIESLRNSKTCFAASMVLGGRARTSGTPIRGSRARAELMDLIRAPRAERATAPVTEPGHATQTHGDDIKGAQRMAATSAVFTHSYSHAN